MKKNKVDPYERPQARSQSHGSGQLSAGKGEVGPVRDETWLYMVDIRQKGKNSQISHMCKPCNAVAQAAWSLN